MAKTSNDLRYDAYVEIVRVMQNPPRDPWTLDEDAFVLEAIESRPVRQLVVA